MFNQKFYYMWQKYFIVIILFTGQMYDKSGDKHYLPVILYKKVSASDK